MYENFQINIVCGDGPSGLQGHTSKSDGKLAPNSALHILHVLQANEYAS